MHDCIVCDECDVSVVLRNRRLFQAPSERVSLNHSRTNVYAYEVWLHRVRIVVTTNAWLEQVAAASPSEAQWLSANAVVVAVTEPLYETHSPGSASVPAVPEPVPA